MTSSRTESAEVAQLSLFGASVAGRPEAAPQKSPPATPVATVQPPAVPAAPVMPVTPVTLRHPQADREIAFGDRVVGYTLKRVRRRSIGFMVGAEGLSVNAPKWVGLGDIESALHEKSKWILRKLGEQQDRARRLAQSRIDWRDGTTVPYLGEPVIVVVDARAAQAPGGAVLHADAEALPGVPRMTLHVGLPHTATASQLREAVQGWLQHEARRVFEERCRVYTDRVGVRYSRLRLSSAQTRWGSASADGTIRLNWRLIHFPLPTIDYVVAHELAHLREMNHSPRFWAVVRSVLPDFEAARDALKAGSVPMFD